MTAPKKVQQVCQLHGAYEAVVFPGQQQDFTTCPQCARDGRDARRHAQQKKAREERREAVVMETIPSRYLPARLEQLLEGTEEQRQLKDLVGWVIRRASGDFPRRPAGAILLGTPGNGKTLAGCIMTAQMLRMGHRARFVTLLAMIRELRDTWGKRGKEGPAFDSFTRPDLLVIDEVGVQFGSDTEKVYFTELLNDRYSNNRMTVLITNMDCAGLRSLSGDRVWDRLQDGGRTLILTGESLRK